MFKSTGVIQYDPFRGSMKNRTSWWCVLNVDREITRYYRYWINQMVNPLKFDKGDIHQPAWDAHISIIRGEKPYPDKMHLWRKYQGERVEFSYALPHEMYTVPPRKGESPGIFFLVDVECPKLIEIRKEFGFKYDWKLHMTIGRTYE